jgi:hypothetical protein
MEIYRKLLEARDLIKKSPLKKEGKNTFSGYEYFKPSQISQLAHEAEMKTGLVHLYSMERNDAGYVANLMLFNIEKPEEHLLFTIPTSMPDIKATNEAQKLGGAVTYSERYLLMIAFDIVDNSLDFDTTENSEKQEKKEPELKLPEINDNFWKVWNKEILPGNMIEIKGKKYKANDKQIAQCTDYLHKLEELWQEEQLKEKIANDYRSEA